VQLNDGNYLFVGRKDRTVQFNGLRVAIEEIQYNLRKHPDVADAAVSFNFGKQANIHNTYHSLHCHERN
jgi:acyl-coenzyme A synthetase/AMP-(fatty) acid ligase